MELFQPIAIVDPLPQEKGQGLVAVDAIPRGTLIAKWYPYDRRVIATVYASMDDFTVSLPKCRPDAGGAVDPEKQQHAQRRLQHSWPTPDGKIVVLNARTPFGMINHYHTPNVLHTFQRAVWSTTAARDLQIGEELVYDYNLGSKYDVRTDRHMQEFHAVCAQYQISKRPTRDMTLPPCTGIPVYEEENESRPRRGEVTTMTPTPRLVPNLRLVHSDRIIRNDNDAQHQITSWV